MERLIRGGDIVSTKIDSLLVEQRRVGDEYRALEGVLQELKNLVATGNVALTDRTEMEAGVVSRSAELARLGQRMLELDASVTIASLRPT